MIYSGILYHGTPCRERLKKEGFKKDMLLSGRGVMAFGVGFYATPRRSQANKFGDVVRVRVTLHDPIGGKEYFARFGRMRREGRIEEITDILKSEGYDGILIQNHFRDEVCVFDAENIKVV